MKLVIKPPSGEKGGPKHAGPSLIAIILRQKVPKYKGLGTKHFTKKK